VTTGCAKQAEATMQLTTTRKMKRGQKTAASAPNFVCFVIFSVKNLSLSSATTVSAEAIHQGALG
jgi:hypothetical protein